MPSLKETARTFALPTEIPEGVDVVPSYSEIEFCAESYNVISKSCSVSKIPTYSSQIT